VPLSFGASFFLPFLYGFLLLPLVDFAPIANPYHENANGYVLDGADDPIIAHAVFPKFSQPGAFEGFPNAARIIQTRYPIMKHDKDALRDLRIELRKLFSR
jgi:hypothetical protein